MAPFAEVGPTTGSPLTEQALDHHFEHLNRFFSYMGHYAYKDKFNPTWEPRYLAYKSDAALPVITLAIIRLTEEG
jgi:phosphatidylglycerol lysyltransferase